MNFLMFLLIGLLAGWLAGILVRGGGMGLLGNLVVGVAGAFIGGTLFDFFGFAGGSGMLGSLLVATVGAVVLLVLVRAIKRG
jgi:uncharacterized membrane protein YeaQ/YmgE (transglycosylase-associated protein family)